MGKFGKGIGIHGVITGMLLSALTAGCAGLESIPYSPQQTPPSWLTIQPFVNITLGKLSFILIQPSSTILVYLLGIVAIATGIYYFKVRGTERTRLWWGIALVLWGIGALLAGTSYEAFSYEIKCRGQALCSWTSWWEIFYLILSAASINAMVAAGAYSNAIDRRRRVLLMYAALNSIIYFLLVFLGVYTLNKLLISFEMLLVFAAPGVLILFIMSVLSFRRTKERKDLASSITWVWLGVIIAGYFLYYSLGFTGVFWQQGVWFSENDILHIGLITWMIYLAAYLAARIYDLREPVSIAAQQQ
jgi:hypothetical protein